MIAAPGWDQTWADLCFAVAYVAFGVGLMAAIGAVLGSDFLIAQRRLIRRRIKAAGRSVWIAETKVKVLESGTIIGLLIMASGAFYFVHSRQEAYELSQQEGILYPADDPMPAHPCGTLKNEQIVIFMGSNVSAPDSFPHTALRVMGKDRIIVNREQDGAIRVSLEIFDVRGILVAQIANGKFKVARQHLWDARRNDRSTLEIFDFQNNQVLKIRYLNSHAIWIEGVLRYPEVRSPIVIDGNRLGSTRSVVKGNCSYGPSPTYSLS